MTVGGIATLLVAHDYLEPRCSAATPPGESPTTTSSPPAWRSSSTATTSWTSRRPRRDAKLFVGYNLFGLERVGLASGLKYIGRTTGTPSWPRRCCRCSSPTARGAAARDGRDAIIDTAYVLLFLCARPSPGPDEQAAVRRVLDQPPARCANLAGFASREMERPLNWQVVDIQPAPDDWADSPILYLASHRRPELDETMSARSGSSSRPAGCSSPMPTSAPTRSTLGRQLAKKLFPGRAGEPLAAAPALLDQLQDDDAAAAAAGRSTTARGC